ncbi:MAG: T9SS type A sorting domain-containing protein [Bacteroidota bacterium]
MFDAMGQRIYQTSGNLKAGKLSIDVSGLAKGMYHVQLLSANNKSLSNSFIKQ